MIASHASSYLEQQVYDKQEPKTDKDAEHAEDIVEHGMCIASTSHPCTVRLSQVAKLVQTLES